MHELYICLPTNNVSRLLIKQLTINTNKLHTHTHTQLQRYATLESGEKILQQSLSNKDKGYLCQHNSYSIFLVIATAGIVLGIVKLAIVKMYQVSIIKDEFEKKMNLSIILSIGITTFVFNIIEIVLNIIVLNTFVKTQQSTSPGSDSSLIDQHITTKWIVTIVPIAMFLITAIITGIWLFTCNKSTKLPTFSICCIKVKWLYPFIIASFFTFVLIEGANITPAFLMLLNAPQVTIFILIYAVTHFGTIVLMLSIYILSKFQGEKWTKEQSIVGFGSSTLLLLVIGFLAAIYMVTLLSATREESPDLITYVVTLIPSILSIIVGYKAKEKLFKYKTTGTNKEEQNDSEIATGNNEEGEQQQQHSEIDIENEQTEEHVASTHFLETEV